MKSVHSGDSVLAGFAAAVHMDAAKNHSIQGFHIHSHHGHPWNELVDSICTYYKDHRPLVVKVACAPLSRRVCYDYQMSASMQDPWVLDSLAVDETYCYNTVKALPPEVIARRIDNPDYMQWDSSCAVSSKF